MGRAAIPVPVGRTFGKWTVTGPAAARASWTCRCACGSVRVVYRPSLTGGKSLSCGCVGRPLTNMVGQRWGHLLVLAYARRTRHGEPMWRCRCDCGVEKDIRGTTLRNGVSTTCGCARIRSQYHDLAGQQFGRLTVVALHGITRGKAFWNCRCQCGASTTVLANHLRRRLTQSCGCLAREQARTRMLLLGPRLSGPDHPNWRADLTPEDRERRRTKQDVAWSKSVMARDGFKCVACGKGGRLQAHHLEPYASAKHLRLDLSNGVTLCKSCHLGFHKAKGFTRFSALDFADHFGLEPQRAA